MKRKAQSFFCLFLQKEACVQALDTSEELPEAAVIAAGAVRFEVAEHRIKRHLKRHVDSLIARHHAYCSAEPADGALLISLSGVSLIFTFSSL